ncbi:ferredoxin [Streptomyces sp. NBC_01012]|uniref:ferredoxin n=1 Tax=Streptomyces sp. NBC_01012 TaxID=2903717 RepID=UPI003863C3E8|nr:ferredoxin [Streptomyces sp. NBC_01012]
MKVTLDQDKCVASGQCVVAADDVFDQDDDGIAVLLDPAPAPARADDVQQAAAVCPALAIRIEG